MEDAIGLRYDFGIFTNRIQRGYIFSMETLELHYFRLNDDEFYEFCQQNGDLKLERDANGTILILPNAGGKTGDRNSEVNFQLRLWNKQHKLGTLFDSSIQINCSFDTPLSGEDVLLGLEVDLTELKG